MACYDTRAAIWGFPLLLHAHMVKALPFPFRSERVAYLLLSMGLPCLYSARRCTHGMLV